MTRCHAGHAFAAALLLAATTAGAAHAQTSGAAAGSSGGSGSGTSSGTASGTSSSTGTSGFGVPAVPRESPVRLGSFFGLPYGFPPPPGAAPPTRNWTITPSAAVDFYGTDSFNGGSGGSNRGQSELITTVTPGIFIGADTARLQGNISYLPALRYYANNPGQNRVDQNFNGTLLATLVPGSVFLDLRGSANVTPTGGGSTPQNEQNINQNNRTQNTTFSATPYIMQRFGGRATAMAGYTYQYANQSGTAQSLTPGGLPFFTPNETTSHTGFGAVRTGEDFGPLAVEGRVTGTTFQSNSVLDGAYRYLGIIEGRYAITRSVALLLEGGYERAFYDGIPPIEIDEPVWGVGVRLEPGPGSVIFARYLRRDGFNSLAFDGRLDVGDRTVLFANYSERLGTAGQRNADLLSSTSVDALGNVVDTQTGAPVIEPAGSAQLATQNGIFRNRNASASIAHFLTRDTFTLTGLWQKRTPVSLAPGTTAFEQESTSLILSWQRQLRPDTALSASGSVGRFESASPGTNGDTYSFRITLQQNFSETLSGYVGYELTNQPTTLNTTSPLAQSSTVQNAIVAGLRKSF
jgi:uncharacterized protein (PEP-CTERM system associated)